MSESSHAVACLLVGVEPEFHLAEHVLVHLFQRLELLLLPGLLLVKIFVREFLKVLWVDLFHDKVEAARRDEITDISGVAR